MEVSTLTRLRFSPWLVQLVTTRRCNLRCGYCNEYDTDSPPVPLELMIARLNKLRSLGAFAVELSGGEPLLHPKILELVRHATSLRFIKRMIITNGTLLTEPIIQGLNSAGLTDMQISIDGVQPNEVTVKTLVPLRRKLERLARLARFKVTVNAVIGSTDPEEAREVARFAQDHGFRITIGLVHDDQGALTLSPEQKQLYRELKRELKLSRRIGSDYIDELLEGRPAPYKCRAGARYLYVDEEGLVHYCSQVRDLLSRDLMSYGAADLKEQFAIAKPCTALCTIGCVRTNSALDQWRP